MKNTLKKGSEEISGLIARPIFHRIDCEAKANDQTRKLGNFEGRCSGRQRPSRSCCMITLITTTENTAQLCDDSED